MPKWLLLFFTILLTWPASVPSQIMSGYLNDFNDGSLQGWHEGGASPNQPVILPTDGPDGLGDSFLRNISSGMGGPGGKCVMFNSTIGWTGNYFGANVNRVSMHVRNPGSTELYLRIAYNGEGGVICSKEPISIPPDSIWQYIQFSVDTADMILLTPGGHISTTLETVSEFRILSSFEPSWTGDQLMLTMDIDNILAGNALLDKIPEQDRFGEVGYVLFPNPTIGLLTVRTAGNKRLIKETMVFDHAGNAVWRKSGMSSGEVIITLPTLPGGIYWLLINGTDKIPFMYQE
jgi:hypothetical protein